MPADPKLPKPQGGHDLLDPVNEKRLLIEIVAFVRRRAGIILTTTFLAIAAGWIYTAVAQPIYVAQAQLVLDLGPNSIFRTDHTGEALALETVQMENQLKILGSENIIGTVAKELDLASDPELGFAAAKASTPTGEQPELDPRRQREIFDAFQGRLQVRRLGLSSAIAISYRSTSPTRAATIVNGVVDAYLRDQITRRSELTSQGGQWLKERIEDLRKKMNASTLEIQALRAKRDYRIPATSEANPAAAAVPDATLEELEVKGATYRKIYESYMQAYFTTVYEQSFLMPSVQVVSRATPPRDLVHPRAHLILPLAALAGLLMGFGVAFVRDTVETTIHHPPQIADLGVTFLGAIPPAAALRAARKPLNLLLFGRPARRRAILVHLNRPDINLAFQLVRSRLPAGDKRSFQPIIITSVFPAEGKTVVAMGLADMYAASGTRTLLVDANFDNATLSHDREASDKDGLVEALLEVCEPGSCIMAGSNGIPDFLPAGRNLDGVTRLLREAEGNRLRAVIEQLLATYDVVILNSAPLASPRAIALSCPSGGAILVCRYGQVTKSALQDGLSLLMDRPIAVLGALINRIPGKVPASPGSV